jgi:hypothetical protein
LEKEGDINGCSKLLKHVERSELASNEELGALVDPAKSKERLIKLVKLAMDEKDAFTNLRLHNNSKLFETFVEYCLVHFVGSHTWRWQAYIRNVSEIFSVSDEAFAMLLIENNAKDLEYVYENQVETVKRKDSRPKYTKVSSYNGEVKFQGWHQNGVRRYNELVLKVKENQKSAVSKDREVRIQENYKAICGKMDGNENSDDNGDFGSDDEDGHDDEDAIDEFDWDGETTTESEESSDRTASTDRNY